MYRRINSLVLTAVALLLVAVACGPPPSPEEQVSELRSRYTAELNGFVIHQEPAAGEEMAGETAEGEGAGDETAADEQMAEGEEAEGAEGGEAAGTVRKDALLDILMSTESRETLPGITVDVTQVDADGNQKGSWRVYLDTADVQRGPGTQITHRLEDVDYVEGDGFHVEVRHPVPAEERGEYREFQEYDPSG